MVHYPDIMQNRGLKKKLKNKNGSKKRIFPRAQGQNNLFVKRICIVLCRKEKKKHRYFTRKREKEVDLS